MSETLAIHGGPKVRTRPFPAPDQIGEEEKRAVLEVMDSGVLSKYLGAWHADFLGGPRVRAFETAWAADVGAKHAVAMNSAASGLFAAVGAAGVGPGDEVITTPYTMAATATAIVGWHAVPVFADIEDQSFNLDPASARARVTPRTRAILAVHLFGHAADMDPLIEIAREHNLVVIEDAAQAPGATYKGRRVGALGDMTVFSLNYHKHIHTGEGGVVTTASDHYAERLQLIRNHGEAVVGDKGVTDLANHIGYNLRLTEIAAAIGVEQLRKLPRLIEERIALAEHLARGIGALPGIRAPRVQPGSRHVYYCQPFLYDARVVGVPRDAFVAAVGAELPSAPDRGWPLIGAGYVAPLYHLPM